MNRLFWRATLAFLLLPGVVAGLVPWCVLRPPGPPVHVIGLGVVGIGVALLLWCVRDFYVAGKGTLAPWDPPTRLVQVGLYRYSRNPMYVAVLVILVGWAVAYRSWLLAVYAVGVATAVHLRVLFYEEPALARLDPEAWAGYKARVPRWLAWSASRRVRSPNPK